MRVRTLLPYLVGLFWLSTAAAADWTVVRRDVDDKLPAVFIDKDSISTEGAITKAWFLLRFPTTGDKRPSERHMVSFKCAQKRILRTLIQHESDTRNGQEEHHFVFPLVPHNHRTITHDSISSAMLKAACTPNEKSPATPGTRPSTRHSAKDTDFKRM